MYLFTTGVSITGNFVDEKSPICKLSGTLNNKTKEAFELKTAGILTNSRKL